MPMSLAVAETPSATLRFGRDSVFDRGRNSCQPFFVCIFQNTQSYAAGRRRSMSAGRARGTRMLA